MTGKKSNPTAFLAKMYGEEKAAQLVQASLFEQATPEPEQWPLKNSKTPTVELQEKTQTFNDVVLSRDQVLTEAPKPRVSVREWIRRVLACPEYERMGLTRSQDKLYRSFLEIGLFHLKALGQSAKTTTVTYHIPAELVMAHAGYKKTTFYDALPGLRAAGLVVVKGKTGAWRNLSRKTGSVVCVKLNPRHTHIWPKIHLDELKHEWRDLEADIQAGKTAYQTLNGESKISEEMLSAELLVSNWTLPPSQTTRNTLPMTLRNGSDAVWDIFDLQTLREATVGERSALVSVIASGIARRLNDMHSVNFYQWALWQTLRLSDKGIDQWGYFFASIERMSIAQKENAVRKTPGARLVDEWKRSGFYQELKNVPQHRVGTVAA